MPEDSAQFESNLVRQLASIGAWSAILLIVLTVFWIISLAMAPAPPADASLTERFAFVRDNDGWQFLSFLAVVPMGLVHIPVWLGLAAVTWHIRPAMGLFASAFGLFYGLLTVMGYWLQLTTVRGLGMLHQEYPETAETLFPLIHFSGEPWSMPYGLVVIGYGVWGIAALFVGGALQGLPGVLGQWTAGLFAGAGVLGIIGGIGFVAQIGLLELGVLVSGILFLPAIICAAVLMKRRGAPPSHDSALIR